MKLVYAVIPQYAHFFADNLQDPDIITLLENYEEVIFQLYKTFDEKEVEYTSDMKTLNAWIKEDEKADRTVNSLQALHTENMLHKNLLEAIDGHVLNKTIELFDKEKHKGNSRHYKQTKFAKFVKALAGNKAASESEGFIKDFYFIFFEADINSERKREAYLQLFVNNLAYFK